MDTKTNKIDITQVGVGMFWYEDDTFSFDRTTDKKIKAIVELVENNVIYGDLTASELFDIPEKELTWYGAKRFYKEFSYSRRKNENIVWYDIDQLKSVYGNYNAIKKAFKKLHKPFREKMYWSSTERGSMYARYLSFSSGRRKDNVKYIFLSVRPVLALKVK